MKLRRAIQAALTTAVLALAACAPVGLNQPLAPEQLAPEGSRTITTGGYRIASVNKDPNDVLVLLAFSGGGTRSAALALGVLKGLRDTTVRIGGRDRRLLDEVDVISSVSGGSMVAAYYALHRERVFTDFERDFLRRDINAEVYGIYLLPWNWRWLFDPEYGTNDAMQAIYDRRMYHGATYADLQQRGPPLLLIQATDINFGTVFTFSQDQFDVLCSDLARVPIARAVAASAGVPVLFTPITIANHAERCGGRRPAILEAEEGDDDPLSRHRIVRASRELYFDNENVRYAQLLDGGVSDNLALRGLLNAAILLDNPPAIRARRLDRARRIVLISVDGQGQIDRAGARQRTIGSLGQIINAASGAQMNQYNFETERFAREQLGLLAQNIARVRCSVARTIDGRPCGDVRSYYVRLGLEAVLDPQRRRRLQQTPTALTLPSETIDELIALGESQVRESPELARFINEIDANARPPRRGPGAARP